VADAVSLGVVATGELAFFDVDVPAPRVGELVVETLYSGLSAGTELTYVKGTDPAFTARRDPDSGVFVHGEGSRHYPVVAMGYMEVGRVVESRRENLPVGTVVAAAYGHRSRHLLGATDVVVPVPDDVDPLLGIYVAQMGPIAANGLLHAAAELSPGPDPGLGDGVRDRHVVVTGAGVVGLLTALFARRHGAASVVVADPDRRRLDVAEALGVATIDEAEPWRWCKEHWVHGPGDRGADLVFQCRGRDEVLHEALRCLRPQGTVIDLAFYQGGASGLRLGEEFHHNGLTIRCAQIARVPRGTAPAWDRARLSAETLALLRDDGPAIRRNLVTDVVPLAEGPAFITSLAKRERQTVQLVLDFRS
jgi:threonine dehydrogenase-like Zn-dependent dehydrogenase